MATKITAKIVPTIFVSTETFFNVGFSYILYHPPCVKKTYINTLPMACYLLTNKKSIEYCRIQNYLKGCINPDPDCGDMVSEYQ